MIRVISAALALGLLAPTAAFAGEEPFKVLHVAELVGLMKGGGPVRLYDVNVASTRAHAGIIPGAHLLSSSSKFDVARELPAEKQAKLVFYCANTQCTASHEAARRALEAGYADVSVMVDGIYGWKK